MGGPTQAERDAKPVGRNWTRVVASWFVVFFIVASWSILFRAFSPLLFGSSHRAGGPVAVVDEGARCVLPLRLGLAQALADAPDCEAGFAPR